MAMISKIIVGCVLVWVVCGTIHLIALTLKVISRIIDEIKEIINKMGW